MLIYAGIDEAGYGPMFGPLVIGRAVFGIERGGVAIDERRPGESSEEARSIAPDLWKVLSKAVCKDLNDKRGRITINDSKKVKTAAAGIRHMELGVLAFAGIKPLASFPARVCDWLDAIGERTHQSLEHLPWYHPCDERPWGALPTTTTAGEVAIARNILAAAADDAGVRMLDLGAAVVFEDRFNRMVAATRSKASASFTFVASHLASIWDRFGEHGPIVAIDRQSGRMRYRELLAQCFPSASITVMREDSAVSAYRLRDDTGGPRRSMMVHFEVNGDGLHLPVSLASMVSKYTRELMMMRFNAWFTAKAPQVAPTAGYATDAKRFWSEIQPLLPTLEIRGEVLRRMS
jgi:hypothetical protein